jgi:3-isopropylmalate/(R)-2-methylmalate dehydratase large subunit
LKPSNQTPTPFIAKQSISTHHRSSHKIACPHTVDNVKARSELAGTAIDQVVIGSCTNGRLDDIEIAASIVKGKKIARSLRMLVFPASGRIYRQALEKGYLSTLMDAGAVVMNPGAAHVLASTKAHSAMAKRHSRQQTATSRDRMGNPNSEVYLCSPALAAASALTGVISDPRKKGN